MSPRIKIALTATLLTLAQACSQSPSPNPEPLDKNPGVPEIPAVSMWPQMTSIDARPVFSKELSSARPVHAVLDVESLVYRVLTVQYRIQWLDARGNIINPDGPFKILNMAPRTQIRLDIPDPTGSAVSWRAEFRPAM
jgi:hypothetical protein